MHPLLKVGPLNLSTGGLLLLASVLAASSLVSRIARRREGAALVSQVESIFLPAALGTLLGARVWYGVLNWDLYARDPALFVALRIADLAWPGGLVGGALVGWLWARSRSYDVRALADTVALALPATHVVASVGLLLSGEAFGMPTDLPWGINLFGAVRHPTQLYYALAALVTGATLWQVARVRQPAGVIGTVYVGIHGLTLLLIEPLRADSLLLPGGVRAAQLFGLILLVLALVVARPRQLSLGTVSGKVRGSEQGGTGGSEPGQIAPSQGFQEPPARAAGTHASTVLQQA